MQKYWLKKVIVSFVIILFIGTSIIPVINGHDVQNDKEKLDKNLGINALQGNIILDYDPNDIPDTIEPETETVMIPIYIDYFVSGLGARLIVPFLEKRKTVPIELSLEDVPEWCDAGISPKVVYQQISTSSSKYPPRRSYVMVSVASLAPAFESFSIKIKAKASSVKGAFGLITYIEETENIIPIQLKSGYFLEYDFVYPDRIYTPPLEKTEIIVNISCYSNARTRIHAELLGPLEDWDVYIPSEFFLGPGKDSYEIIVSLTPPSSFIGQEFLLISIRISAAGHPEAGIYLDLINITLYNNESKTLIMTAGLTRPLLKFTNVELIDGCQCQIKEIERLLRSKIARYCFYYFQDIPVMNVTDLDFTITYRRIILPLFNQRMYRGTIIQGNITDKCYEAHKVVVKGFNGQFTIMPFGIIPFFTLLGIYPIMIGFNGDCEEAFIIRL